MTSKLPHETAKAPKKNGSARAFVGASCAHCGGLVLFAAGIVAASFTFAPTLQFFALAGLALFVPVAGIDARCWCGPSLGHGCRCRTRRGRTAFRRAKPDS